MTKQKTSIEFGYYPFELSVQAGPIRIASLPTLAEAVADVAGSDGVERNWIYAPPQEVRSLSGATKTLPYPSRVFGLPKTHVLEHAMGATNDHITFLLWALSFLTGMRLTAAEAGFLDATPILPGMLVDFGLTGTSMEQGVWSAESFWQSNRADPQRAKLLGAAVHALFLGQNQHNLQFEDFVFLHTALDACYRLAASQAGLKKDVPHAVRVTWMCTQLGVGQPPWSAEIARLRNQSLHEALFMDEPLGFAVHGAGTGRNIPLEMRNLTCRVLLALLGVRSEDYLTSPIDDRQRRLLRL